MKNVIALLLAVLLCLPVLASCSASDKNSATPSATPSGLDSSAQTSPESPSESAPPVEEQQMKYPYGVYNIVSVDSGKKVCVDNTNKFVLDTEDSQIDQTRFTLHIKERTVQNAVIKYYGIYIGDDETKAMEITSTLPEYAQLRVANHGYQPADKALWTVEDYEDGTCRIVPCKSLDKKPMCLAVQDGKLVAAERDDTATDQLFRIEKAPASTKYNEYVSDKGEVFLRIHPSFIKKSTGITDEMMQDYVNFMQEALEAEVELTGYRPYDILVISGWEELGYVAGVSDNYNFINASKGFMLSEMSNLAYRRTKLNIMDLSFGMLHEMGHMFDSGRGWNFESEAWTDLKLCYVLYKMTLNHKDTDGYVFGCAAADYAEKDCFTYETMANGNKEHNGKGGLNIHANKGAMETVYGFFGAARLFLLMAYDFGWDPFIKTFHWYQDNGYTQNSFTRWERFTNFVEKLSEYSGKDIKKDYLSENNWKIFDDYYNERTKEVV